MAAPTSTKKLWIFCTAVFAMGFVASAYLNFVQYQNYQGNTSLLNGTITDLKYQLNLDGKALATPTPTPSASATPSPTATPSVAPTATPAAATAVTNQLANLHSGPDVNTTVIKQLSSGTTVTITGTPTGTYQPVSVNGTAGYVRKDYLTY